ncbi:transcription factor [Lactococcus phage 86501]|nr:transcription factor [Lactococcus phage 50101]ANS02414.1 transcription factor [Lactococcus phage 50101]ANS02667.1 transcription factor [Lactococcus phage 86501]
MVALGRCEKMSELEHEVGILRAENLKLRNEVARLSQQTQHSQPQLNAAKKYIEHVIGTIKHDGHLGTIQTDWILPYLEKTLAAIGGDR